MSDTGPQSAAFAQMLASVERACVATAEAHFGDRARRQRDVVRAVRALSDAYRARDATATGGSAARLAQLRFFTLADLPKSAFAVSELRGAQALPARRPLRVLDVGAGCGAQSLGVMLALAEAAAGDVAPGAGDAAAASGDDEVGSGPTEAAEAGDEDSALLEVDALDVDAESLELLGALLRRSARELGVSVAVRTEVGDVLGAAAPGPGRRGRLAVSSAFGRRRYDLVVAGTVFAEVEAARHLSLARALLGRLAPQGALVIVEPALRDTARPLHALRDALLAEEDAYVFAPCTHGGPCPALQDERDWCHESRRVTVPPGLHKLIDACGLRRDQLKWSYVTLRREPKSVAAAPGAFRVVSELMRSKGKREAFLCGAPGRVRVTRLDRDRSPSNNAWRGVERGHLVWLDGVEVASDARETRVGKGAQVTVVDPVLR